MIMRHLLIVYFTIAFISGTSYLLVGGPRLYAKLYEASRGLKPISMEDAFVTGIAAQAAGIPRFNARGFHWTKLQIKSPPCSYLHVKTVHKVNDAEKRALWQYLKPGSTQDALRQVCGKS